MGKKQEGTILGEPIPKKLVIAKKSKPLLGKKKKADFDGSQNHVKDEDSSLNKEKQEATMLDKLLPKKMVTAKKSKPPSEKKKKPGSNSNCDDFQDRSNADF